MISFLSNQPGWQKKKKVILQQACCCLFYNNTWGSFRSPNRYCCKMSLVSYGWLCTIGKWGSKFELREGRSGYNWLPLSPRTSTRYYLSFLAGCGEHGSSQDEESLQFWRIIVCPAWFEGTQTLDTCWWKESRWMETEDYQWSHLRPSLN